MSWPAKYPGTCTECGGRFEVGDEIEGSPPAYRHQVCPDDVDTVKPTKFEGTTLEEMGF